MTPPIYLDHNAGAPLRSEVAELIADSARHATELPANPSSVHGPGRAARARLDAARGRAARALGCNPRHLFFTASGTEANAWAVRGTFALRSPERQRIVASAIEHPALLLALRALVEPAQLTLVPPGPDGAVSAARMAEALGPDVALCVLMWANNETGVVQPVADVSRACATHGVPLHVDAVQAVGRVAMPLALISDATVALSGHKLGASAGTGALIAPRPLLPLIPGHQESGHRGGTPDVGGCEALALALELAMSEREREGQRLSALRDGLEEALRARFPDLGVNGQDPRLPGTSNLRFDGVDAETLLIALDLRGFAVSTGAACASGSITPSHVLLAMGLTPDQARSSLRVSLGHGNDAAQLERFVTALVAIGGVS